MFEAFLSRFSSVILLLSIVSVSKAGRPPFNVDWQRECGQGQRLFGVLKFTAGKDGVPRLAAAGDPDDAVEHFLLPRCDVFEPSACVRGCRWISSCSEYEAYKANGGRNVYLAGLRYRKPSSRGPSVPDVVPDAVNGNQDLETESYCCESLSSTWDLETCVKEMAPLGGFPYGQAIKGEIVRNFVARNDTIEFEVCRVLEQNTRCKNPPDVEP